MLTLHSAGVDNVVSMLGSCPSADQIKILANLHIPSATVLFDADKAGRAGAEKMVQQGNHGIRIRFGFIPEDDPAGYTNEHGIDATRAVIGNAVPLAEYVVGQAAEVFAGEDFEAKSIKFTEVTKAIQGLPPHDKALALVELSKITGVPGEDIKDMMVVNQEEFSTIESERQILASCIQDHHHVATVESRIGKSDVWTINKHRHIWNALVKLKAKGVKQYTSDLINKYVPEGILLNGTLDQLYKIQVSNLEFHINEVKDAHARRSLRANSIKLSALAFNKERAVSGILSEHLSALSSSVSPSIKHEFTAREQVELAMDYVHTRMESEGTIPGIDLGHEWRNLMELTLGFQPSYMYILSALPKTGKTATALNWCLATAVEKQIPSLWLNLEMSERDLALRNLSILSGVSNTRMRMGQISAKEKETIDKAAKRYYVSPLHVVNAASMNLYEIINVMRKYVYTHGVKVIFIDYIQLIKHEANSKKAYWEQHSNISTEIKSVITELNVPTIAISQLSKASIEGGGTLNIAGSFKYLQDCDMAMELRRRTQKELDKDPKGNLVLNAEFNRHGPQDVYVKLLFNQDNLRCQEI